MKGKFMFRKLAALTAMVVSVGMMAACGDSAKPEVSITLDGVAIAFEEPLQNSIDGGLITTNAQGEPEEPAFVFGAMEVSYSSLHLGTSTAPNGSGVSVLLYNDTNSTQTAYASKVMTLYYDLLDDSADQAPVLFNDIDFWGMTQDDAIAALREKGFEIDTDTLDEGYHFIVFSGKDSVIVNLDFEQGSQFTNAAATNPRKAEVQFDPDTYYVSKLDVSMSSKLNIDYGGAGN